MAFRPFADEPSAEFDPEAELAMLMASALTLKTIAEQLGISLRQVQNHIDDGSLVAVNVGRGGQRRDLRVLPEDLEGFLRRRRTAVRVEPRLPGPSLTRPTPMPSAPSYAERRAARLAGRNA